MKIAVAGGTGMLGAPVVKELLKRGHEVRVIGRSSERMVRILGPDVEAVELDLLKAPPADVSAALANCHAVHISLAGAGSRRAYIHSQHRAVQKLVDASRQVGLGYITYLSAATATHTNAAQFYDLVGKQLAEEAVLRSGIRHCIYRPSWFVETLPLFVQFGAAMLIGDPKYPQAWLTAGDYAEYVASALENRPESTSVWLGGPETATISEALARYAAVRGLPLRKVSVGLARALAAVGGGHTLRLAADLAAHHDRTPDYPEGSKQTVTTATGLGKWLQSITNSSVH